MYKLIYLSIDPGTNTIGTAINAVTTEGEWVLLHAHTTHIGVCIPHLFDSEDILKHGMRIYRALAVERAIYRMCDAWSVNHVVSESPYMNKFATAFAALTECLLSIRRGCLLYDSKIAFTLIDPSTIKVSVGVKGNSGDKKLMSDAVLKIAGQFIDVSCLDEHSVDAIAAGYAYYKTYLNN